MWHCRRRCRIWPRSSSSTTTPPSTARPRSASACSSGGRRRSTRLHVDAQCVMTPERKAIAFWLAVGTAGFSLVPWYALEGSLFSTDWIRGYAGKEAAPALVQGLRHGRIWLLPLGSLLLAGLALLSPRFERALRARGLLALGAAGFLYLLLEGFAIGPRGWSFTTLGAALGPLAGGQDGMGLGALLVAAAFAMLFALGLAERGLFAGDGFIAACVVAIAVLTATFIFFPVLRILSSALRDSLGGWSASAFFGRLLTAKVWGLG